MINCFESDIKTQNRKSSKGNQLKFLHNNIWYKTDNLGYEGISETVISKVLEKSNLKENEYVVYDVEQIKYKNTIFLGCKSHNFLKEGWSLITLQRLFQQRYSLDLYQYIYKINLDEREDTIKERLNFIVNEVEKITGISNFGTYLCKLLTIDAIFLNEDRHMHNIALLIDPEGNYHLCPIFDNGAGLLSDISIEYPLDGDVYNLIKEVKSKTVSDNFDEQLDCCEKLYGQTLEFKIGKKEIKEIILKLPYYDNQIKNRIYDILMVQVNKYSYLFKE